MVGNTAPVKKAARVLMYRRIGTCHTAADVGRKVYKVHIVSRFDGFNVQCSLHFEI
jgi:hypothetical protein